MSTRNAIDGGQFGAVVQAHSIQTLHVNHRAPLPPPLPPFQLPPVTPAWEDREDELADLAARVRTRQPYTSTVEVLCGEGGVGKSALAIRWLAGHREATPDGQLYVNLRAARHVAGTATVPTLLRRLIRDLGHPPAAEATTDDLALFWRTLTASKRLGVLLDDAVDAAEVRALLPGGEGHLVAVTAQRQLTDLHRDGARLHEVAPLSPAAADALLVRLAGGDHRRHEPAAVRQLAARCKRLPLHLCLAAAQLAARPGLSAPAAAYPSTEGAYPSTEGITVMDDLLEGLPAPTARACRLLATLPAAILDTHCAAATLDLSPADAIQTLTDLAGARLLEDLGDQHGRGTAFRLHDQVRRHAGAAAERKETPEARETALRRWLDWLLGTTTAAERLLTPTHREVARDIIYPPASPVFGDDKAAAQAWLVAHEDDIVLGARKANAQGLDSHVYQLPHAAWPLWRLRRPLEVWLELHQHGLEAAIRCQDRLGQLEMLTTSVIALRGLHDYTKAIKWATRAYRLAHEDGDRLGQAQALHELGECHRALGKDAEAVDVLQEAISIRKDLGEDRGVAISRIVLGLTLRNSGHLAPAVEVLTLAQEGLRLAGDRYDAARAAASLGEIWADLRQFSHAEKLLHGALEEMQALGSAPWESRVLTMLGQTAAVQGRRDEAGELYRRALEIAEPGEADSIRARLAALEAEETGWKL